MRRIVLTILSMPLALACQNPTPVCDVLAASAEELLEPLLDGELGDDPEDSARREKALRSIIGEATALGCAEAIAAVCNEAGDLCD